MTSWAIRCVDVAEAGRSPDSLESKASAQDGARANESCACVAIVDDDTYVLRSMERLLRSAGYSIKAFSSAEELLSQLNSNVFSCLVLDVRLRGMNGLELQDQLVRSRHAVPIVFVTAADLEDVRAAALQAGAIAYLRKPVNEGDLLNAINAALGE